MIKKSRGFTTPIPYDPSWLLELTREQLRDDFPDRRRLLQKISGITHIAGFCQCGCLDPHFLDRNTTPHKFLTSYTVRDNQGQDYLVDVLDDYSVVSIQKWRMDTPLSELNTVHVE